MDSSIIGQMAAFLAAGGGAAREKTDTEFLKEIAAALNDKAASQKTLREALESWWQNDVLGGGSTFANVVRLFNNATAEIRSTLDAVRNIANKL